MSIKEYFAIPIIKQKVLDFLKAKGDFEQLHQKHKRSFRAHVQEYEGDFFICDDQHQIKCVFSNICKEKFEQRYPSSVKIYNIVNMLVCVQEYQLQLQQQDLESGLKKVINQNDGGSFMNTKLRLGNKLEVVMEIDDLQVISFDRFTLRQCQSIDYDESIRIHINFVMHFLSKKSLLEESKDTFQMFPINRNLLTNENIFRPNKVSIISQNANHQSRQINETSEQRANSSYNRNNNNSFNQQRRDKRFDSSDYYENQEIKQKILEKDHYKPFVEFKSNQSKKQKPNSKPPKQLKKKLGKLLNEKNQEGFLSCDCTEDYNMMDEIQDNESSHSQILQQHAQQKVVMLQSQLIPHSVGHTQRQEELKLIDDMIDDFEFEEEDLQELQEELKDKEADDKQIMEDVKIGELDSKDVIDELENSSSHDANNSGDQQGKDNDEDDVYNSKLHKEILLSQQNSMQVWSKQNSRQKDIEQEKNNDKIEDIIREEIQNVKQDIRVQSQQELIKIAQDEDVISNSDSVIQNEILQKEIEDQENKDKIQLEFELTDSQKQQDQQLIFASLPPEDILGVGLHNSQFQKELREFKKQGQGGQLSGRKRTVRAPESDDDLLDILDDGQNKVHKDEINFQEYKKTMPAQTSQLSDKQQKKTQNTSQKNQKTPKGKAQTSSSAKQAKQISPPGQMKLFDFMIPKRDIKHETKVEKKEEIQNIQSSNKPPQKDQSQQGSQKNKNNQTTKVQNEKKPNKSTAAAKGKKAAQKK
ncbi:UNKNOWN [Stylonychia lemnae]|uniref:Shelterin complex subunit TPP1/Est3 domain-containing protein n=1 Tax=Stylonychia lemnae TaxID=5949 RepID=A0A078AH67_STYLE|nr:UNKNOWN [Stylonychia lemnae]|eukprot:CDW81589.1 UNKNOWN [Stylonychia lemnae]